MRTHEEIKSSYIYKFSEKALPLFVWLTITMPLWLSPFHPAIAAYLILGYFVYFLYKALKMVYFASFSLNLMNKAERTDWRKLVEAEKVYKDFHHVLLIVTATESEKKLQTTIEYFKKQKYDLSKTHVVLAMEDRMGKDARDRYHNLKKKFGTVFASFEATFHVMQAGEVVGKASNAAFAATNISKRAKNEGWDPKKVIITVCDADSLLPDHYLACLTYKYIKEKDREYRFYTAPVLLYNNFWKLPFPVRMQTMLSSVARLGYLSLRDDLIQISTYSTSLWLLEEVEYWDVDIIPEDWHIWMQAFYTLGERVKTIPIYLPIIRDGVLGPSVRKTLKTRYEQEKRWAWGATDIPYAITRYFNSPNVNFWAKSRRLLYVMEVHFMWPTAFFILTLGAAIPTLVNPTFERTVLGQLLPQMASLILTFSTVLLLAAVYFDYHLRKKAEIGTSWKQVPMLFIQWAFLPIVSFAFSSLPALESHTRMLLGKNIEYKITEKAG